MRVFINFAFFTFFAISSFAQTKVHSHNDYALSKPFFGAYEAQADQIEADIFLIGDSLIVAHSKKEVDPKNTLNKLYLDPINLLFTKNQKQFVLCFRKLK